MWLAGGWLGLTTLGCIASALSIFTPQVLANEAIVTVPLYVSGWAGLLGAWGFRKRERREGIVAAIAGAGVGLLVGLFGLLIVYEALWPGYL